MIDMEAIKKRHLDPERMSGRTYYEGHIELDLAACVKEIERLRELLLNAGWSRESEGLATLARQAEREAVVAWLRAEAARLRKAELVGSRAYVLESTVYDELDAYANNIERSEHRREGDKP